MKENKNIVLEFRRDFDKYVTPEKEHATTVSNVGPETPTIEEQLNDIRQHLSQIAMFVGMPYTVPLDGTLTLYPARKGNARKVSDEGVSYTVDLRPYREHFAAVRFMAKNTFSNEDDIVRGIIVDDSGNVECTVDNRMNTSNPWIRLPLSSKSCTLIATVPLKNGNPMWTPEKVEYLPQGLALDVADITEDLYMDILDICNEVIPLKRECKNRNAANAAIC